jgi:uncharacterized protein YidB (DUF937 family)
MEIKRELVKEHLSEHYTAFFNLEASMFLGLQDRLTRAISMASEEFRTRRARVSWASLERRACEGNLRLAPLAGSGGGLLSILNSIDSPAPASQGLSPMAKALLALLAILAKKNMTRADPPSSQPAGPAGDNLLRGTLGAVLGGAAAGTVVSGGLHGLLKQLQQSGQGDVARSWVGAGPNKAISQGDLASSLGTDTLDALSEHTGMDRGDLLAGLSQHLPGFVDQCTMYGWLPTEDEASPKI